jgi:hypothetical protein
MSRVLLVLTALRYDFSERSVYRESNGPEPSKRRARISHLLARDR